MNEPAAILRPRLMNRRLGARGVLEKNLGQICVQRKHSLLFGKQNSLMNRRESSGKPHLYPFPESFQRIDSITSTWADKQLARRAYAHHYNRSPTELFSFPLLDND